MVTENFEWAMFSYNSNDTTDDPSIKGGNRTQLILSLFNGLGLTFKHADGVKNKDNVIVARTVQEGIDVLNNGYLFDTVITRDVLDSYTKTIDFLWFNTTKSEFEHIVKNYLKIIDNQRLPVPSNLIEYWHEFKDELNLTGRFVPEWQKEILKEG